MILAAVKSDAEALGQAATQAPQPMHWAASIAVSTVSFGDQDGVRVPRARRSAR